MDLNLWHSEPKINLSFFLFLVWYFVTDKFEKEKKNLIKIHQEMAKPALLPISTLNPLPLPHTLLSKDKTVKGRGGGNIDLNPGEGLVSCPVGKWRQDVDHLKTPLGWAFMMASPPGVWCNIWDGRQNISVG
jgi:hypothetical protein